MDGFILDESACTKLGKLFKLHESGRLVKPLGRGQSSPIPNPDLLRVRYRNVSGQTIPAYGVTMLFDRESLGGIEFLNLKVADAHFKRRYFVNGTADVENQGFGWGTWLSHSDWVLYSPDDGTPQIGEQWGVKRGEFMLFKDRPGFYITGGTDGDTSNNTQRVKAIQHTVDSVIGLPTELIAYLSVGDVTVYIGPAGGESTSGLTVDSCFNPCRDFPSGEPVRVIWPNGQPLLLPIYDQITVTVKPVSDIAKGNSGQCEVFQGGTTTGTQVTATALGAAVKAGKWALAWQETASGEWLVGPWECA